MIPYDCLYIIRSIFIAAIFRNKTMVSTPLRISNAHVNVAFALVNRPKMGDLIVQRCKNHVIQHNMICGLGMESQITRK
jgi:hypothetical protein